MIRDQMRAGQDPELRRLTGTHRTFTRADVEAWAASRADAEGPRRGMPSSPGPFQT